ncbi:hypothetical protein BLOT_002179 [Blomia tropicalis]|nr:hypothetical protein BLOT_002179 [Blomia tropicalis]
MASTERIIKSTSSHLLTFSIIFIIIAIIQCESEERINLENYWVPQKLKLNESCVYDFECGKNVACFNGQCQCKFSYHKSLDNDFDCVRYRCKSDVQCLINLIIQDATFMMEHVDVNTIINLIEVVLNVYPINVSSALCVNRMNILRCQCQDGFIRSTKNNGINRCIRMSCDHDRDCAQWPNNECNEDGVCACRIGYQHTFGSKQCLPIEDIGSYGFLAQNLFLIVIISNFLLWMGVFFFVLKYMRQRRMGASNRNSHHDRLVRNNLPPNMPPPPPSYDNIAFDPPAYSAPPPYSSSIDDRDANKNQQQTESNTNPILISIISNNRIGTTSQDVNQHALS